MHNPLNNSLLSVIRKTRPDASGPHACKCGRLILKNKVSCATCAPLAAESAYLDALKHFFSGSFFSRLPFPKKVQA
jgi:hypothetical protein